MHNKSKSVSSDDIVEQPHHLSGIVSTISYQPFTNAFHFERYAKIALSLLLFPLPSVASA